MQHATTRHRSRCSRPQRSLARPRFAGLPITGVRIDRYHKAQLVSGQWIVTDPDGWFLDPKTETFVQPERHPCFGFTPKDFARAAYTSLTDARAALARWIDALGGEEDLAIRYNGDEGLYWVEEDEIDRRVAKRELDLAEIVVADLLRAARAAGHITLTIAIAGFTVRCEERTLTYSERRALWAFCHQVDGSLLRLNVPEIAPHTERVDSLYAMRIGEARLVPPAVTADESADLARALTTDPEIEIARWPDIQQPMSLSILDWLPW